MLRTATVCLLAFTGGFTIMAVELLGGRMLAPFFGSSIHVWGSIITVFMLSLSMGYLVGGRMSLHRPSLTRFAALFLVGAVVLYPLMLSADGIMEWVFEHVEDPRYGSLAAALLLFTVPTVMLGMISPYSVILLVRHRRESGRVAGMLYFMSSLGSALGTLGTSFYLVLWFEVNTILVMLSLGLLACGLVGILVDRRTVAPRVAEESA